MHAEHDRYLLRQFLSVFAICFCSLAGLYIVADALGNLEEFLSQAAKGGGLAATLGEYYSYRVIAFFDRTSGILALIPPCLLAGCLVSTPQRNDRGPGGWH